MSEAELYIALQIFARLQVDLLRRWRDACSGSVDTETLLDFPKKTELQLEEKTFIARRHGRGVAFEAEDVLVDVPHGVATPEWFDSDRFHDYLRARGMLGLIGESNSHRETLAELFRRWADERRLRRRLDDLGRTLYAFAVGTDVQSGESRQMA